MKLPAITLLAALGVAAFAVHAQETSDWIELFNGKDLSQWEMPDGSPVKGWDVQDGAIHRAEKAGNIHSKETFKDFELVFEWKVAKGTNSGVKYRFHDGLGPEYQVIDDVNGNEELPHRLAAALYYIKAPEGKKLAPIGEWNTAKIIADGNRLEHWLNNVKVLEIEIGSEEWKQRFSESKYVKMKNSEGYAEMEGPIHLQEHGGEVWYRGMKIRRL